VMRAPIVPLHFSVVDDAVITAQAMMLGG